MKKAVYIGLALLPLLLCKSAIAEESRLLAADEQRFAITARTGFGLRDHDATYQLHFGLLLERKNWLVALQAPLYGIITDNGQAHYGGMRLSRPQWDDVSDAGRVINEIRLGQEDGPAQLRLGRVNGLTYHHGSLLENLYSQLNPDASGLTIAADFRSRQGHSLSLLVVEPFKPALVAISGSVHPLAPWFHEKSRTISALAINLQAFVDPTIVGKSVNYGAGFEIEQSFFIKNVYLQPFNTYAYANSRNHLGAGLEIGRRHQSDPGSWQLTLSGTLLLSQGDGQPVSTLYLLERQQYPLLSTLAQNYGTGWEQWPEEWHGALKGQIIFALPGRFLAHYSLLANLYWQQFENSLHIQGSFFGRWSVGAFILGKKYSPRLYNQDHNWLWLASLESAVAIWKGLTIDASYGYLITDESLPQGRPAHQFMISIGYEYGRKTHIR